MEENVARAWLKWKTPADVVGDSLVHRVGARLTIGQAAASIKSGPLRIAAICACDHCIREKHALSEAEEHNKRGSHG